MSSLPLSVLENVLHPKQEIIVFTVPGEDRPTMVYPSELIDLYIQTRIELNEYKEKEKAHGKNVKTTKSEEKLETEQSMEKLPSSDEHSASWDRPNNKKQVGKNRKLTSSSCDC